MTLAFIGALVTSGAVWMIGSDRIQAVAAYDGAFFPYFGIFNRKLGTPVRVNMMSGIVSSLFFITAVAAFNGGQNAKFVVVLDIAISTTLISYLWIFAAPLKLRYSHGHVYRPYRHPWGMAGLWVSTILIMFWIALGSFEAVFPDVLEKLFGVEYNFKDSWSVTRGTFEVLTLGTLAVILVLGFVGYFAGARVRQQTVDIPLDTGMATEGAVESDVCGRRTAPPAIRFRRAGDPVRRRAA
jgi:glutamate:GABA antiporter